MTRADLMQHFLLRHLGIPYLWGGDDPISGFDCSGFAQEFLSAFGAHPSPGQDLTAQGLHDCLKLTGRENVRKLGALAFYGKGPLAINHVAVLIESNLIFEFGGGGSSTTSKDQAIMENAFGRIRPLERRRDLVTVILPKGIE